MVKDELEQAVDESLHRIQAESEKRKREIAKKVEKLKDEIAEKARKLGRLS